jgi:hypothetical protein
MFEDRSIKAARLDSTRQPQSRAQLRCHKSPLVRCTLRQANGSLRAGGDPPWRSAHPPPRSKHRGLDHRRKDESS